MEPTGGRGNVEIKRLDTCTFRQAVELWNDGFSGYYSDATLTMERYISKLARDSIRPELSVVAFADGVPAGFVLVGLKTVNGEKIAWNGGTGVGPAFRGQGISKTLMREATASMKEEGVAAAILEVVQKNTRAIVVYESAGFRTRDSVIGLKREGALPSDAFKTGPEPGAYRVVQARVSQIGALPYYRTEAAWSSQWYNLTDSDGYAVIDGNGSIAAYALGRRKLDDSGKLASATLFQCEADPTRSDSRQLKAALLSAVFGPTDANAVRRTDNLSMADPAVIELLEAAGFETVYTQYVMFHDFGK